MGFLLAHIAWQIDQFPICWPMNGIFVHWSRGWGVLSFSERLVHYVPKDKSDVNAKGRGQRSKVKVAKVNTQLSRFRTATPVWIHIWWWNGAQSFMLLRRGALLFLAATKQLYEWYFLSVCLSVRLSVCLSVCLSVTPFWLCSHHRIIMKFSGVITKDQGNVHAKGQGHRGHNPT